MKRIKKIIILSCLLSMTLPLFASFEVGLAVGFDNSHILTSSSYYYEHQYYAENGFSISIPFQYNLRDNFSIRAEVNYLSKNYLHNTYQKTLSKNTDEYCYNGFIEVPFMLQISSDPLDLGINWFMNAGCYLDIWLTRHHKGTTFDIFEIDYYSDGSPNYIDLPTFDTDVAFVSLVDNRLQVGLLVGTGFDYQITEKVKVFTEVRYLYSLSGLTKDSSQKDLYNKYNRTIVCQLGAMYCF